MRRSNPVSALLLSVVFAGTVLAAEGRIPIFEPLLLDGTAGNISGKYVVTRDVESNGTSVIVDIIGTNTEAVDIDLNGFTLTGGANAAAVIRVRGSGVKTLKLRNGTLIGVNQTSGTAVVDILGDIDDRSESATLEDLKVISGDTGVHLRYVTNFAVRRNVIVESVAGLVFDSNGLDIANYTGVIENNILRNLSARAISLEDENRSVRILDNEVVDTDQAIVVGNSTALIVTGNAVQGGSDGITVGEADGCLISRNTTTDGSGSGIWLDFSRDCMILENVATANSLYGIEVTGSDRNFIDRNTCNANQLFGIYFDVDAADNVYGRNVARGNVGAVGCTDQSAVAPCAEPEICDEGTGNTSIQDNVAPDRGC